MTNIIQNLIAAFSSNSKPSNSSRTQLPRPSVGQPVSPAMAEDRTEQAGRDFLKLIFQDDTPYFVDDKRRGYRMLLDFGRAYFDDIDVPEITFHVELMQRESEWFAGLDVRIALNFELQLAWQPRVEALLARMNDALRARSDFDLAGCTGDWKKEDPRFHASVMVVG